MIRGSSSEEEVEEKESSDIFITVSSLLASIPGITGSGLQSTWMPSSSGSESEVARSTNSGSGEDAADEDRRDLVHRRSVKVHLGEARSARHDGRLSVGRKLELPGWEGARAAQGTP